MTCWHNVFLFLAIMAMSHLAVVLSFYYNYAYLLGVAIFVHINVWIFLCPVGLVGPHISKRGIILLLVVALIVKLILCILMAFFIFMAPQNVMVVAIISPIIAMIFLARTLALSFSSRASEGTHKGHSLE
jgi:hypothetical protein